MIRMPDRVRRRRQGPAAVLALALAACTSREPPKVEPNIYPSDYRKEIIAAMPSVVADTSNIREAGVTDPALMKFGDVERYASCVRFNPKKSKTEYAGVQERVAIFFAGQLTQFPKASPEQCGHAAYKPFPELEKLCLRERC